MDQAEASRGSPAALTITATRAAGFTDEIALSAVNLPANVTASLKNIPKGEQESKGQLTAATNAALGQYMIGVTGKAKLKNVEYALTAQPFALTLSVPFDLRVDSTSLKLTPGDKGKIKVTAVRKGGYEGPIEVELRNLPAGVTAPKATIAAGQRAVDIEVTAAANAAAANKADVQVRGTATAAGKETATSPNLTVSIAKE
jgi:hypothetical protein